MALFPARRTSTTLSGALGILRRTAAARESTLALAAEHERKAALSASFTPGMTAQKHALLEMLSRHPVYGARADVHRQAVAPTRTQVARMAELLRRVDNARRRGVPLAQAFAHK